MAAHSRDERDRANVDFTTSGVAYRNVALQNPCGTDPAYQKDEK
ncbi:DNA polymerase III subunit theta [Pantoea agglomerans]|nr:MULTISPECIES: DNA polymerase III subunit theta [Pantoea]MDN4621784.1 DNA polymerase III subunit theta [Pantoea agglomerans]